MIAAAQASAPALRRKLPFAMASLTPFAPGVAIDAPLSSPDRCLEFWSATPLQAVGAVLDRVGRRPDDVEARPDGADTVLLARVAGVTVPLAFIGDEMPSAVVAEALAAMRQGVAA